MKKIIIDIEGDRHMLVQDAKNADYCTKEKCSMFGFCQRAPVTTCTAFATSGYHFERITS